MSQSLPPWGKAVAGATGAVTANLLVYPLDIVKTKLQIQVNTKTKKNQKQAEKSEKGNDTHYRSAWDALQKIYQKESLPGLYKGLAISLVGTATTNFAYFYWYGFVRERYSARIARSATIQHAGSRRMEFSTATELALGAVAGALAQMCTMPIGVITTRLQAPVRRHGYDSTKALASRSVKTTIREIWHEDGPRGFWCGLKASLVLVSNPSITYGSAARIRNIFFNGRPRLSIAENFLIGACSKAIATVSTQPLIVAKTMQQAGTQKTFTEALAFLLRHDGIWGLFKGLGPQLSKGVLVQGLLFMIKDKVEIFISLLLRLFLAAQLKKHRVSL
ncbi:mitochondrial carrier [Nadsonia fulvescens var. elongata DSM 6958]|uniref:Mitochondrial carrier n=1 Tax=Nadsonia fulvescens var. elongata DSM 6958 TaxID=857566 RepID=A0A1E3PJN0_9ASCO|nr:mitochondrial carrier [Nadsonia fulvescens var. elongata DSM 6958]